MLASVPAPHIYHNILNKLYHSCQSCNHIGGGCPFQSIFGFRKFGRISNICCFQPGERPFTGIKLHRQGNQGKQYSYGHNNNAYQQDCRVLCTGHHHHTGEQNPVDQHGTPLNSRHHFTSEHQGTVLGGMLYGMAALVGCHGSSGNTGTIIYIDVYKRQA